MIKRNMALIVTNQFLTVLSDSIFSLAIMWYVYEATNSALSTSLIVSITSLTNILVGPFIGVLVDRREPKTSIQVGYALMIFIGIILSTVYIASIDLIVLFIYLALVIHVVCMLFIGPAKNKLLPRIVGIPRIVKVNGYISSTSETASLIGQSISGFIIGIIGFAGVMLFHSAIYLLASILLMFVINISLPKEVEPEKIDSVPGKGSMFRELKEGLAILKGNRPIFKLILLATALNATTIAGALLVVLVSTQYGANAVQFGLFNAAAAVSGIVIGLMATKVTTFSKPYLIMFIALFISGVTFLSMGLTTNFYFGTLFYVIMTVSLIVFSILVNTLMIVLVEDKFRGRVLTLQSAIASLLIPAFSIIGGIIGDLIDIKYLFVIAGLWVAICAFFPLIDRDIRAIKQLPIEDNS